MSIREEFREFAENQLWKSSNEDTAFVPVDNVSEWWINTLKERIEAEKTSKEYDAMVKSGDLSFLNYTPTQIYTKALDTITRLLE